MRDTKAMKCICVRWQNIKHTYFLHMAKLKTSFVFNTFGTAASTSVQSRMILQLVKLAKHDGRQALFLFTEGIWPISPSQSTLCNMLTHVSTTFETVAELQLNRTARSRWVVFERSLTRVMNSWSAGSMDCTCHPAW